MRRKEVASRLIRARIPICADARSRSFSEADQEPHRPKTTDSKSWALMARTCVTKERSLGRTCTTISR